MYDDKLSTDVQKAQQLIEKRGMQSTSRAKSSAVRSSRGEGSELQVDKLFDLVDEEG